jgi:hypothetical protein
MRNALTFRDGGHQAMILPPPAGEGGGESFGLVSTPLASLVPLPTEMGSATVSVVAFGVPPNASFSSLSLTHRLNLPAESRPANLTGQKQAEWTGKLNKKIMQTSFPLDLPAMPWLESIRRFRTGFAPSLQAKLAYVRLSQARLATFLIFFYCPFNSLTH